MSTSSPNVGEAGNLDADNSTAGSFVIRLLVWGLSAALVIASILLFTYFQETKPKIDVWANHATISGLMLSVAGFGLTIWTLFEGMRVNRQSQNQVKHQLEQYHLEFGRVLNDVRSRTFRDACHDAYSCAEQARVAIGSNQKLRAVEKTEEARKFVFKILQSTDLAESERNVLREVVSDLQISIDFIRQQLRPGKPEILQVPPAKAKPYDRLCDELDQVRSRLDMSLLEISNGIR